MEYRTYKFAVKFLSWTNATSLLRYSHVSIYIFICSLMLSVIHTIQCQNDKEVVVETTWTKTVTI